MRRGDAAAYMTNIPATTLAEQPASPPAAWRLHLVLLCHPLSALAAPAAALPGSCAAHAGRCCQLPALMASQRVQHRQQQHNVCCIRSGSRVMLMHRGNYNCKGLQIQARLLTASKVFRAGLAAAVHLTVPPLTCPQQIAMHCARQHWRSALITAFACTASMAVCALPSRCADLALPLTACMMMLHCRRVCIWTPPTTDATLDMPAHRQVWLPAAWCRLCGHPL